MGRRAALLACLPLFFLAILGVRSCLQRTEVEVGQFGVAATVLPQPSGMLNGYYAVDFGPRTGHAFSVPLGKRAWIVMAYHDRTQRATHLRFR